MRFLADKKRHLPNRMCRFDMCRCRVRLFCATLLCYAIVLKSLSQALCVFFRQVQKEMSAPAMKVARGMGKPANVSYFCASRFSTLA